MNTTENNKLIAEFLGLQLEQDQERLFISGLGTKLINETFNTDWNWLMRAIEKCFKIKANYGLHKNIEDALIFNSENRIQDVYNAVVKFIEVYNESFKQEAVYSIRD